MEMTNLYYISKSVQYMYRLSFHTSLPIKIKSDVKISHNTKFYFLNAHLERNYFQLDLSRKLQYSSKRDNQRDIIAAHSLNPNRKQHIHGFDQTLY